MDDSEEGFFSFQLLKSMDEPFILLDVKDNGFFPLFRR